MQLRSLVRGLAPALLVALATSAAAAPELIVVLGAGDRRELLSVSRGAAEWLPLDPILEGLGLKAIPDATAGTLRLVHEGREVVLYRGKSFASIGGELRLLSAATQIEGGQWLVAVDAVPKVLGPLLDQPVIWRPSARVLAIGAVAVPKATVRTTTAGDATRVTIEFSEPIPFEVEREPGRVQVALRRDLVDVTPAEERVTGGIVERVQFVGGRRNLIAVVTGPRFDTLRVVEDPAGRQLVLELTGSGKVQATPPAATSARPARPAQGPRVVVLDPGHGGPEVGAKGPGGTLEKDVTLQIARRLRAILVNDLGLQVFLTRDSDVEVELDQRTALANNYKADLFVSIHANAARARGASGSEVYFLSYEASDDESRRVAQAEGAHIPEAAAAAPGAAGLDLILWEMAQAEHLEESSFLASRLQEELAAAAGSEMRGVKQAPFRVLVGAAMPAVLVEAAFISNPEEEQQLASEGFQQQVARALARGIARYEAERARRQRGASPP